MISRFLKKLRDLFSSDIPDELVACEFECREVLKKVSQKNLALDNGEMN